MICPLVFVSSGLPFFRKHTPKAKKRLANSPFSGSDPLMTPADDWVLWPAERLETRWPAAGPNGGCGNGTGFTAVT